ncbi:MAG: TerC family protein [Burkholderiaceae bacterium]
MTMLSDPAFWVALGNIILVNIVLSGDNAVVIAMAARTLPPRKQKQAVLFGSVGAIVMRIVLTVFALQMLTLPYLKIVGGILLFWIGLKLLIDEEEGDAVREHATLWDAIRTILVADLVMSLDNVLGVAAAAEGSVMLLVLGLAISIPLIVFGSSLILKLMERFRAIIVLGAALLGYLSGEMLFSDAAAQPLVDAYFPHHDLALAGTGMEVSVPGVCGALLLLALGRWLASRRPQEG